MVRAKMAAAVMTAITAICLVADAQESATGKSANNQTVSPSRAWLRQVRIAVQTTRPPQALLCGGRVGGTI